ncbi:MAG: hypothetical protein SFV54_13070 [Bryobacteraceae bacterium]|nr:hypothetical protein [Bryobacteraceae bacterium]
MPDILMFCEDSFHERFLTALLKRVGRECGVHPDLKVASGRGGLPKLAGEFKDFMRDATRPGLTPLLQILVVADANCLGYHDRRAAFATVVRNFYPSLEQYVEYAIPDPHIERWMLLDPGAFKTVFGRGCTLPKLKCDKDEYKRILRHEIRQSGLEPLLGGEEFAGDIVSRMNLSKAEIHEPSFGLCLKAIRSQLRLGK